MSDHLSIHWLVGLSFGQAVAFLSESLQEIFISKHG